MPKQLVNVVGLAFTHELHHYLPKVVRLLVRVMRSVRFGEQLADLRYVGLDYRFFDSLLD